MLKTNQEYLDVIKFPGQYNLKNTDKWREKAIYFEKYGYYCPHVEGTVDYINFWNDEEKKILNGTWIEGYYIPGYLYFYLNYLPIYVKKERRTTFPHVQDRDYHTFLCLEHAIFLEKHFGVLKCRQSGFTLKLCVPLIRELWFERGSPNYIATFEDAQVGKTWTDILEVYRDHLNEHTAWYRDFHPGKLLNWRVAKQVKKEGRTLVVGRKNTLKGLILSKSPTKGVGGGARFIFADESGVNKVLKKFLNYVLPMVKEGARNTGTIIVSGAVGELAQSQDLKEIIENPEANGFYYVENKWDKDRLGQKCGFFVPPSWNYEGKDKSYFDENGNSFVEEAEQAIINERKELLDKGIDSNSYMTKVSQEPLNIAEAFQYREESIFPVDIVSKRIAQLEYNNNYGTYVDLKRDSNGNIKHEILSKYSNSPVLKFPVKPSDIDIDGVIQIFEFPKEDPEYGLYWAGVDIVRDSQSSNSPSLNSIYIYKSNHNIKGEFESKKLVACYTGRPKDKMDWFNKAIMLQEYYNAVALVENNIDWYITEVIRMRKQRYIAKTPSWIKEINPTSSIKGKPYGVNMTEKLKEKLIDELVLYVKEEIHKFYDDKTGELINVSYGVDRIDDIMILKEMLDVKPSHLASKKDNYDRLIAGGLSVMYSNYNESRGIVVTSQFEDDIQKNYENTIKNSKLSMRNFSYSSKLNSLIGKSSLNYRR